MRDPFLVRGFEGIRDLPRDVERFLQRNRSRSDSFRQRRAIRNSISTRLQR